MTIQGWHDLSSGVPVSCLFVTERPVTSHLIVLALCSLIWKIGLIRLSNARQRCKSLFKYRLVIHLFFLVILRPCFYHKMCVGIDLQMGIGEEASWGRG